MKSDIESAINDVNHVCFIFNLSNLESNLEMNRFLNIWHVTIELPNSLLISLFQPSFEIILKL